MKYKKISDTLKIVLFSIASILLAISFASSLLIFSTESEYKDLVCERRFSDSKVLLDYYFDDVVGYYIDECDLLSKKISVGVYREVNVGCNTHSMSFYDVSPSLVEEIKKLPGVVQVLDDAYVICGKDVISEVYSYDVKERYILEIDY